MGYDWAIHLWRVGFTRRCLGNTFIEREFYILDGGEGNLPPPNPGRDSSKH